MRKILSLILILVLIAVSPMESFAEERSSQKEEVVYGILDLDGNVEEIYVVNIFEDNNIIDYGDYINIKNMTSSDKIVQEKDRIKIDTSVERLYYEGTLKDKQLPWNIRIDYLLDGEDIKGKELAGKSGALQINIFVDGNPQIDSTFFDNYALQIGLVLDTKLANNIKSTNATVAEAGSKKQLTYTVLPGDGIDITVLADVKDFEIEPITVNGIMMNLGMTIDNEEITGQISQLTDAISQLDSGAQGLLNGVNDLEEGMNKYVQGLRVFKDGLKEISLGVDKLNIGTQGLSQGLLELDKQRELLINGAVQMQDATFNEVNKNLSQMNLELPKLNAENYEEVFKKIEESYSIQEDKTEELTAIEKEKIAEEEQNMAVLSAVKEQLDGVVQFTKGLNSYAGGVSEISIGAADLAKGTEELNSSISIIPQSANDLYIAGEELNAGIKKLKLGLEQYKNGTNKLENSTSNMDAQINNSIDEIVNGISGNGDEIVSFVSDKNTDVLAVQFVMKTEEIKITEIEVVKKEIVKLTFIEKLLNLFGLNK